MSNFNDLKGQQFSKLTVLENAGTDKHGNKLWLCQCECGKQKVIAGCYLRCGKTKSCGCLRSYNLSIEGGKNLKDLTGMRFNKLTVIERAENPNKNPKDLHAYWKCLCECGKYHIARSSELKNGHIQSCGCYAIERSTTHGMRDTRLYTIWCNMKARCYNSKNRHYKTYGGRGIEVSPLWKDNFQAFYEYVSKLPHFGEKGYTINRIDNDLNYEPGNIEWANAYKQSNNRTFNHKITYKEKTQNISQWAKELKINPSTLYNRILTHKWSIEKALETPVK